MTMNISYTADLADSSSQAFRTLARTVSSKIFVYLSSSTSGLLSVTVSSFRPGSVVATVNANFQQNTSVDAASVVNTLKQAVANDTENPLGLDTSSFEQLYTADLADSSSQAFRTLARTVSSKIFVYLSSSTSGLLSVTVSSFRPGSVVATVNANFQQNASVDAASVMNTLRQAVANDTENPLGLIRHTGIDIVKDSDDVSSTVCYTGIDDVTDNDDVSSTVYSGVDRTNNFRGVHYRHCDRNVSRDTVDDTIFN
ncbi:PREDICTED: uncharacterized protein LOC109474422 [Branchiostoma belcheri]|uniref:Uncharacterized protein LOC109474422 n=1 Tax=Branchiostoma belcheri TaxID=7741 RepID=A0A6P4ZKV4_BRABE|nr:PREDICTED: uncharacterized protein LOC109474422 [Branchiostoma belcheri]